MAATVHCKEQVRDARLPGQIASIRRNEPPAGTKRGPRQREKLSYLAIIQVMKQAVRNHNVKGCGAEAVDVR
ncbi:MAG: hypothetical protein P8J17_12820 [Halioglobus sp.]|nr:hypothetical protein [Halioglobus sp.]